ncbi:hypothetical protein HDZ31DRAFT_67294 [Schizophyllum fasciatum]
MADASVPPCWCELKLAEYGPLHARQPDLIYRGASVASEYGADAYHRRPDDASADGHPDMPRAGQEDYDALRARYEELAATHAGHLALAAKRAASLRDEMDLLLDAMQLALPSQPSLLRSFPSSPPLGRRPPTGPHDGSGEFPPVPPPSNGNGGGGSNGWNEANTRRPLTPPMVISIPAAPKESPNGTRG